MIAAIWDWLRAPPSSGRAYIALLAKAVLACLVWSTVVAVVFRSFCPPEMATLNEEMQRFYEQPTEVIAVVFTMLVAVEELLRLAPLMALLLFRRMRASRWVVLFAALAVSAMFGSWHVDNGLSLAFSLAAQGVCGLVFTSVYLKCGGLKGGLLGNLLGIASSYAVHLFFNFTLLFISACAP